MRILCALPSRKRIEKLTTLIESFVVSRQKCDRKHTIDLFVRFDEMTEALYFKQKYERYESFMEFKVDFDQHIAPKFWNDILRDMNGKYDVLVYLADDLKMNEDCLSNLIQRIEEKYSDFDFLVGLFMENIPEKNTVEAAFGAIGTKFADRFPDRKVFCPFYEKFCIDKELELYAKIAQKFELLRNAMIVHFHPAHSECKPDETHYHARKRIKDDLSLYKKRNEEGKIWGLNFEQ